jgi:trehalose 6-phosphate synthase
MTNEQRLSLGKNRARLAQIVETIFSTRKLIIASNRGPVEYRWNEATSTWEERRGSGGVVTAISSVNRFLDTVWIACAATDGDREAAAALKNAHAKFAGANQRYPSRFVVTDPEEYEDYYGRISNPLLWFLHHYMWDAPRTPNITRETRKAWKNYERVNAAIADAVLEEMESSQDAPVVMLQDYHLYLCGGVIRQRLTRKAIITHFIHVPWPGPGYWGLLPADIRQSIFRSLCACDLVGFQTPLYARNFLNTCAELLPGAQVELTNSEVTIDGHTARVRVYPISIDVDSTIDLAESIEVREYRQRLRARCGDQTIVRIDRIEPSKNIVRGFQAFEQLLEDYPRYRGRIKFLVFLVPSRLSVDEYKRYLDEIMVAAGWINTRFSDGLWQPIELFVGENYPRAIAAMQLYDVLLVNPLIDGMNLVAKEGPTVNETNGVIVLSEGAGASEQLSEGALVVSPADILGTSEALHQALEMSAEERERRANALRNCVASEDITMWLYHQFEDLKELISEQNSAPGEQTTSNNRLKSIAV